MTTSAKPAEAMKIIIYLFFVSKLLFFSWIFCGSKQIFFMCVVCWGEGPPIALILDNPVIHPNIRHEKSVKNGENEYEGVPVRSRILKWLTQNDKIQAQLGLPHSEIQGEIDS